MLNSVTLSLKYVFTLSRVSEGSEVHFLIKGVFSPISPCLGYSIVGDVIYANPVNQGPFAGDKILRSLRPMLNC